VNWRIRELVNTARARRRCTPPTHQFTNSPTHQFANSPTRQFDRGFTMIELVVVMVLIVILATIGMTQYRNSRVYASESVQKTDLSPRSAGVNERRPLRRCEQASADGHRLRRSRCAAVVIDHGQADGVGGRRRVFMARGGAAPGAAVAEIPRVTRNRTGR